MTDWGKKWITQFNSLKLKIGDVVIADAGTDHESIVKIIDLTPLESVSTVCPFEIEDTENTTNFWTISTSRLTK